MEEVIKKAPAVNQSTEKAFALLELLAQSPNDMRLRDLSETLGIHASTALRFLNSLQTCGYVEQDPDTQRYRLTYKICRIANQFSRHAELQTLTHPYLLRLSEQFHEALCVSVEREQTMVYIDTACSQGQLLMSMQKIGDISPMHSTGNGKLLLLNYSSKQIDDLIRQKGLPRYTEYTITAKEALLEELDRIRKEGVAFDHEESALGVRCLACPIRDYTGSIIAGISVTGPVSRMTEEAMEAFRGPLSAAAQQISASLGYSDFNN